MIWFPSRNTVGGNHERWLFKTSPWDFQLAKIRTCDFFACTEVIIEAAALKMKSVNLHGSRLVILGWCHILMSTYSLCISPQWLKITKNVAFFYFSLKWTIFGIFDKLLATQNVNKARFARNVQYDFFLWFSNTVPKVQIKLWWNDNSNWP